MRHFTLGLACVGLALSASMAWGERSLVAEWKFDEGKGVHVGDTAGRRHAGTCKAAGAGNENAMWAAQGVAGSALMLNGVDQCVDCGRAEDLALPGDFTIQAWVKPAADCPKDAALIGKLGPGYSGFDFFVGAAYAGLRYGNSSGEIERIAFGRSPQPDAWSHVAITKQGRTIRTFLNGAADKTFTMKDAAIATNDRPLIIGCNRWNGKFYKGLIDEVRIYDDARSAEEILTDVKKSPLADKLGAPAAAPPKFDFSKTQAAQRLPKDYFEKQVRNKGGYARWIAAHNELLSQLAPKTPISDEELFTEHIDLSFPGLEATRAAVEEGDLPAARKAFAAFFMRRFPQKQPANKTPSEVTGWDKKVLGWCEDCLAGRIGPLRSSQAFYVLPDGVAFDFREIDPVGFNNYDWCQIANWRQPVRNYIAGYATTGNKAYLDEAVRIINAWYDGFAGEARANYELLTFDKEGRWRQGNLADAAIEFSTWGHWPVAEGHLRALLELAPCLSQTQDPEELAIRTAKIAAEDLGLIATRLPHYKGNFSNIISNDLCRLAAAFAFLKGAPEWFSLAYETAVRNYETDSFPDGATKDLCESYLDGYLKTYEKMWNVIDQYREHDRFKLDKAAFAKGHEKSFEWLLYTSMPDLSPLTFNDCYRRRGVAKDVVTEPLRQLDWCGREDLRWLATERKEGTPPEHTSYPFRTHDPSWAGVFAMRSGWGPDAVYLATDFGPYGGAHGHADYGSFNLFAYGRDLVVDPACGVYGQPVHYKVDKAPQTHNAIMIDGEGQHVGKTSDRPDWFTEPIRTWVTNDVFDAAWGTYRFPSGFEHARIIWFAKPDYYLLVDTLPGKGEHRVRQNFTLAPYYRPEVEGNAVRTHKKRLANLLILPADARPAPEIVKGRTEPMHEGWVMWDNVKKRMPTPAVVYDFEAVFPAGLETILYPTPGGVTADVTTTRKDAKGETGAILVTVTTPTREDQFIIARAPGRHVFPDEGIAFEGTLAAIRRTSGESVSIGLLQATSLEMPGLKITADEPVDAGLTREQGRWIAGDGKDLVKVEER